jgi:hypothetical protein
MLDLDQRKCVVTSCHMFCVTFAQAELTAAGEKVERKAMRAAAASHIWLDWISAKELPAEALLQTVLASKSGASKVW